MPQGTLTLKGRYFAYVYGPDGELKDSRAGNNVVCTNGKEWLASFMSSAAAAASTNTARYLAVGTDSTAEAASNTALGTEIARHTGTVSYVSGQIYQVTATFATGVAAGAIVEYGLFDSSSAGTMLSRDTEGVMTVGASDTLTIIYQLTFS